MNIARLLLFLPFLYLAGCANQIAPGGGQVDKIPPRIISVYPENGTTGFSDDYIEIEFSEYVDKRTVQDAFFISPSLGGAPELNWSGRSVRFEFPNPLQPDVTYVVTFGTEISDLNNRNRMAAPFQFVFSTGTEIDKGVISGTIYDEKPLGVMLFAYPVGDSAINPTAMKPKYISQAGTDGTYTILGLADSMYRIFAVRDEYQDLTYNVGQDMYGVPYTDVKINAADTSFSGLNFFLSKEDTTSPRLLSANMTDRFHILLEFSEEYDSSIISRDNFSVFDSTAGNDISTRFIFHGKTKPNELVLATADSVPMGNNVYLRANEVIDRSGNRQQGDIVSITITDKPDTSAPSIFQTTGLGNETFLFQFTDAFDSADAKRGISIVDRGNNTVPAVIKFIDDASFSVSPARKIKQRESHNIVLNLNNFADAAGNRTDSLYKYRFSAETQLDYTGVSGKVLAGEDIKNIKVVLKPAEKGKKEYQRNVTKSRLFNIDKIDPGKYLLWSYVDQDSSNTYTHGLPFPYKESERFVFYPDTLNLRARWPMGDVTIEYK